MKSLIETSREAYIEELETYSEAKSDEVNIEDLIITNRGNAVIIKSKPKDNSVGGREFQTVKIQNIADKRRITEVNLSEILDGNHGIYVKKK
jgi:hypothetical protein